MEKKNETSIVTNSGDPETFYKWKLNSLILRMVYPQVLSNFYGKTKDVEKTRALVKDIGKRSALRVLDRFPIKEFDIKILIRKLTYKHWGAKSVIKGNVKDGVLRIIIDKCPICQGLEPLEIKGLHYCIPTSGFLEGAFQILQQKYDKLSQMKFTFDTIESKGSNDKKCVHICKIQ